MRAALFLAAILVGWVAAVPSGAQQRGVAARGAPGGEGVVSSIRVEGNERIEEGTIRSYMLLAPGQRFEAEQMDRSLKALFATGLFADVTIRREGSALVVKVVEPTEEEEEGPDNNKKAEYD